MVILFVCWCVCWTRNDRYIFVFVCWHIFHFWCFSMLVFFTATSIKLLFRYFGLFWHIWWKKIAVDSAMHATHCFLKFYFKRFNASFDLHIHTYTHNHFTALWILSGTTRVSRYQKKHSLTHTYHGHQSLLYLLPPSVTIHGIFCVQFTCLTVFFHNFAPSFLWSTSWPGTLHFMLHTFLHPISVFFSQHIPIPLQPVLL